MMVYANAAADITSPRAEGADASDSGTPTTPASDAESVPENEEPTNTNNNNNDEVGTLAAGAAAAASSENYTVPASAVEPAPTGVKCRLCPHGVYAAFPAIFGTLAWLACLSKDGCDYARVTGPIVADITNNPDVPWIDAGFFYYREPKYQNMEWIVDLSEPCQVYNTDVVNIDAAWTFAKFTAFVALVLGGSGAIFVWFASFFAYKKHTWRWAGYEMLAAVVLQALTYTWFATSLCRGNEGQDNCDMHYGAQADIIAIVLWTVAVLFILCKYPKERNNNADNRETSQQTPTEVEMTDQGGDRRAGAIDEHEII